MFGTLPGPSRAQSNARRGEQRQPSVRKVAGGAKPPKYEEDSGLDLYRARLESFLRQRECWNVVIGAEAPDPHEERNLFARDALLSGLLVKDAKKICKKTEVGEMWAAFVRDRTKQDFSNSIPVRARLYGAKYMRGANMEKYLEELEDLRRQLENMNHPVDDEMARIVLTRVEATHRTVVRMFNREQALDLDTILNTLRGEAEMDMAEEEDQRAAKKLGEDEEKLFASLMIKSGNGKSTDERKGIQEKGKK
ncbi:hypothetical protein L916_10129 [Phytophthora nicotianae]|uniref:Uncharacterized protein n=1 Tax=Phytophthora nicotianae TaxID=4792 RepID=W2IY06_PHYNI|nr:hypothetical protein L916_10129 [Phytophthora nicotianae]